MEERQKLNVRAVKSAKHPRTEDTPSKKPMWHCYTSNNGKEQVKIFLKTVSSQRSFSVKKDQGHFTLERHKLRLTERRATGSMLKRGESGVDGCE